MICQNYCDAKADLYIGKHQEDDSAIVSPISPTSTDSKSSFSFAENENEKDREAEQESNMEEPNDVDGDFTIEEVDVPQTVGCPPAQFSAILAPVVDAPDVSLENKHETSDFAVRYNDNVKKVLNVNLMYTLMHEGQVKIV